MLRVIRLLSLVCLLAGAKLSAATTERSDLLPRHARWQLYPSDVRTIKIDRRGKPWFELSGSASVDQIKRQVEVGFDLKAPWVRGARILLFDSSGRIWLSPDPGLLLAYDPTTRQWIERPAAGPVSPGQDNASIAHAICGPAIEDGSGRIFVGDRGGCHVFDHGGWSYQPFYELNIRKHSYFGDSHEFWVPNLITDDHGRVYAWTTWGSNGCTGTLGFWVHEGAEWHQMMTETGERQGHISAIVPLRDGRVLVCPEAGKVTVARIDFSQNTDQGRLRENIDRLGAESFRRRRDAEKEILQFGPHVLPMLRKAVETATLPEQRTRLELLIRVLEQAPPLPMINDFALTNARFSGHDNRGNIVLWADTIGPDGRAGRTAAWLVTPLAEVLPAPEPITEWEPHAMLSDARGRLFLAEYRQGLGVLDGGKVIRPEDQTDLPYDQILGADAAGRVYAQNRWHIAALDLDAPDERPMLEVIAYELSASRAAACQSSEGRTIAKLSSPGQAFLSTFQNGRFKELPVPPGGHPVTDAAYLQPLGAGALVLQEEPGKDVFYFDGARWAIFRGLRELIERQYASLARQIDNRRAGVETYAGLRTDASRNVWCVQWDHVDAYDGKRWRSFPAAGRQGPVPRPILCCLPVNGGTRMLLCDGTGAMLAQAADDGINTTPLPGVDALPTNLNTGIGLRLDSRGHAWLPRSDNSATTIDGESARVVADSGLPRLEDSLGRVWFVNPSRKQLVVIDSGGRRTNVAEPALSDDSTIVEDKPGSLWVNTRCGLRHFEAGAAGALEVKPDPDYFEKGIPKGACNAMWVDAARALWFSGSGRLYRIKLP